MQPINQHRLIMNKKYHIALIGGRGFVGQEVVKLIDNHQYFQLYQIF